jgi:hypothetical protein
MALGRKTAALILLRQHEMAYWSKKGHLRSRLDVARSEEKKDTDDGKGTHDEDHQ